MTGFESYAEVGGTASLICNVVDTPTGTSITYQWKRADISSTSEIISEKNGLILPSLGVSDAGVYICEVTVSVAANNPYVIPGEGSVKVTLTVTSK